MHCPHHILVNRKHLMITLHTRRDTNWKFVTWSEKLNPLRYEIIVWRRPYGSYSIGQSQWRLKINDDAWMRVKFSNFVWKYLGGKRRFYKRVEKRRKAEDSA